MKFLKESIGEKITSSTDDQLINNADDVFSVESLFGDFIKEHGKYIEYGNFKCYLLQYDSYFEFKIGSKRTITFNIIFYDEEYGDFLFSKNFIEYYNCRYKDLEEKYGEDAEKFLRNVYEHLQTLEKLIKLRTANESIGEKITADEIDFDKKADSLAFIELKIKQNEEEIKKYLKEKTEDEHLSFSNFKSIENFRIYHEDGRWWFTIEGILIFRDELHYRLGSFMPTSKEMVEGKYQPYPSSKTYNLNVSLEDMLVKTEECLRQIRLLEEEKERTKRYEMRLRRFGEEKGLDYEKEEDYEKIIKLWAIERLKRKTK